MARGTPRSDPRGSVSTPALLARHLARGLSYAREAARPVLDPACGSGALLEAARRQAGSGLELHGIELEPLRAREARKRLEALGGPFDILGADALDPRTSWVPDSDVIANPPWVSFSGRQAAASEERPAGGLDGWPSLQGAFLARIAGHIFRYGTRARVLVPASLTELESYGPLREAVTRYARIEGVPEELGENAFPGVVEPAVLLGLRGRDREGVGSPAPWTAPDEAAQALIEHLARFPRLPQGTFGDVGVHSGNAAARLVHREPGVARAPIREGKTLAPFALGPAETWIDTQIEPEKGLRFRRRPLEFYRSFPVLVRQTANRPMAALHTEPTFFRNSLIAAREISGLDPAFVVGVLNSPVAAAWHRARFRDARQRAFPQVKVGHLAEHPVPIADRAENPALHDELAAAVRSAAAGAVSSVRTAELVARRIAEAFELPEGVGSP